ncbi:S8 family serine peptidase [Stappia sp.]|uniref:S8 family serine peptidase n=1 Tax=Stappia sp. TaxID=1870903 RepID=UPI0032D8BE0E
MKKIIGSSRTINDAAITLGEVGSYSTSDILGAYGTDVLPPPAALKPPAAVQSPGVVQWPGMTERDPAPWWSDYSDDAFLFDAAAVAPEGEATSPSLTPTDNFYSSQWHFPLLGDVETIWDEFDGSGVTVGIYDDGVEFTHPDLAGNYDSSLHVTIGGSPQSGSSNSPTDGHGTAVAGLIAAANNGTGTVGVAHGATIAGVNIFDPNLPTYVNAADKTEFYNAMSQQDNFDIVNHSWGSTPRFFASRSLSEPAGMSGILETIYEDIHANGRGGLGTIALKAAGNDTMDANGEGHNVSRHTITVAATDSTGAATWYTNFGSNILVAAPAGAVTTDLQGNGGYESVGGGFDSTGDYTNSFGGTSAATPVTSGVVALILDANSDLGWRDVHTILSVSASHTGALIGGAPNTYEVGDWETNGAVTWNGGGLTFHQSYGYGMANAYNAVRMAEVWSLFNVAQVSNNEQTVSASFSPNLSINQGGPGTTTYSFNITEDVLIENVQLRLMIEDGWIVDYRMTLISPDGTEMEVDFSDASSGLVGSGANGFDWVLGFEGFRGESPVGQWQLVIEDVYADAPSQAGTLVGLEIDIHGSAPSTNKVFTYTDDFDYMVSVDASRTTLTGATGAQDWINAAAVSTDMVIDLSGGSSVIDGVSTDLGTAVENAVAGDGNDTLIGNAGSNKLHGMRGDDTLIGGAGGDHLAGGAGLDTADYSASDAGVNVSLMTGFAAGGHATGDSFDSIENLIGSDYDDLLNGDDTANILRGGAGGDFLNGRGGSDTADYTGSDAGVNVSLLTGFAAGGHAAGDSFSSIENLIGSTRDDLLNGDHDANILRGGAGGDFLNGRGGSDTADYTGSDAGVNVSLLTGFAAGGHAAGDTFDSVENLIGSAHDDLLNGDHDANILRGGAGGDFLNGRGGSDTADYTGSNAGVNVSLLTGTATGGHAAGDTFNSIENLTGSAFGDILSGGHDANILRGGAGGDVLNGDGGADTADYTGSDAGVNVSLLTGFAAGGHAAGDTLNSIENLIGSAFDDLLNGDHGNNILTGGASNDVLRGRGGADTLVGGTGSDTADYSDSDAAVNVSLLTGFAAGGHAAGDTFDSIENVTGSAHDDLLNGDNTANILRGGAGGDFLNGRGGSDTADYTGSNASVNVSLLTGFAAGGHAAGDTFNSIENLIGSAHDDLLNGDHGANVLRGGAGGDFLNGRDGSDTADYTGSDAGVNVSLLTGYAAGGHAAGDTFSSIENLIGTAFDDILSGDHEDNILTGGASNDVLRGRGGADTLVGGSGSDTADYSDSNAAVNVSLLTGFAAGGHAAGDTFDSIENVTGSAHDDLLNGDNTANILRGGAGGDFLNGRDGSDTADYTGSDAGVNVSLLTGYAAGGHAAGDTFDSIENLTGSSHADILNGDHADNILTGGAGDDVLRGRAGVDTFVFHENFGNDTIVDFEDGMEFLDFSEHSGVNNIGNLTIAASFGDATISDAFGNSVTITGAAGLIDGSDFIF